MEHLCETLDPDNCFRCALNIDEMTDILVEDLTEMLAEESENT